MAAEQGGVYFPVRASFCDDQVARQVRRRFGHEGFDAYIKLLCLLLREDGGCLALSLDDDWDDLAEQLFGMDRDRLAEFIAVLEHYGAVMRDEDGSLWSPLVAESIAARTEAVEARRRGARASADARRRKKKEQSAEQSAEHMH